ncbi:unnamed protein product [Durusdinium trenchii]|uniref:Uncharacterized protein n=1 Tax=Durusdinium trenchii TaxID=1381693 RepID=A0ABP0KZ89_9DINO
MWRWLLGFKVCGGDSATELRQEEGEALRHGLDCAFTEDRVDWPRILGALHDVSLNYSHSSVMITAGQLYAQLEGDRERDPAADGCWIGVFTVKLVVVLLTLHHEKIFLEGVHDDRLQAGFQHLKDVSLVHLLRSPFAFSLLQALSAYSQSAREACPLLQGPPGANDVPDSLISTHWATLRCMRFRGGSLASWQLSATATSSSPWCALQEPRPPAVPPSMLLRTEQEEAEIKQLLIPLWEALQEDLPRGRPSGRLVQAAGAYFQQERFSCAEVEAAAALVIAWAKLIPADQAVMAVDESLRSLRFPQAVFTRWPIWELMGRLSPAPRGWSSTKGFRANLCLSFEPCKRTVAFYKKRRRTLEHLDCPAPSRMRFTYRSGVLRLENSLMELAEESDGLLLLPELRLFDLSKSLQRVLPQEFHHAKRFIEQRIVTPKDLPLKLGWDGVQINSREHQRRHGDTFLEPSRLGKRRQTRNHAGASVYFLVLESTSRAAFEALCPRTMAFLRRQHAKPRPVHFAPKGVQEGRTFRVADLTLLHSLFSGTAANMLAALSGFSYDDQRDSDRRASWQCQTVLAGVPEERLIWRIAQRHGYRTLFGSTACNGLLGTRYCLHHLKQFDRVVPSLEVDPNCYSQNEWHQLLTDRNGNRGCVGEKRPHQHVLDYALRFQEIHADVPIFAYLHLETTHESQDALQLLDQALVEHLEGLARLPLEAQPVVVLAGDHGPATQCDESFPLVTVLMPEVRFPDEGCRGGSSNCGLPKLPENISRSLRRHYQDHGKAWRSYWWNLEYNRFLITSWYDLYATFWHLISGENPKGEAQNRFQPDTPDQWAQSLLVKGSKERTCTQAGVPLWHCTCARSWEGWCPLAHRGQEEVSKRALAEAQRTMEAAARKLRIDSSMCRPQTPLGGAGDGGVGVADGCGVGPWGDGARFLVHFPECCL